MTPQMSTTCMHWISAYDLDGFVNAPRVAKYRAEICGTGVLRFHADDETVAEFMVDDEDEWKCIAGNYPVKDSGHIRFGLQCRVEDPTKSIYVRHANIWMEEYEED